MDFYSLFLIAIALSLDAFGVALCIGLNKGLHLKNKMIFVFSFGFFQFFFSFIGSYGGLLFNSYIVSVPKIVGGIIIAIVGTMMLKEGFQNEGKCPVISPKMYIILGISVSIDAMVVGFTALNDIGNFIVILKDTVFIGITTFIITTAAFIASKFLKKIEIVGKYADYIGGVILIMFGLKMIFF